MNKKLLGIQIAAAMSIGLMAAPADATLLLRGGFQNSGLSVDGFGGAAANCRLTFHSGRL